METFFTFIGAVATMILLVVIMPFINFWLAYFGGWIASLVVGGPLCEALNTMFGTTRFIPSMIPWIAGGLGWIVSYFKTSVKVNTNSYQNNQGENKILSLIFY